MDHANNSGAINTENDTTSLMLSISRFEIRTINHSTTLSLKAQPTESGEENQTIGKGGHITSGEENKQVQGKTKTNFRPLQGRFHEPFV